ncbi:Hypothetical_protein [Hexamita inflata]|uniref:Hypothetical_protein n=1 Tax=Hexamita inflata TaxID=28002 RepID=A0AA86NXQ8_9EUKA|nr:Hypothetical protein HINF_LOCUS14660 [Hexamita inflata]
MFDIIFATLVKAAPLLPQKRGWYDAGGFPYRSACTKQPRYAPGCLYPSRWLFWLRRWAYRTQVYLKLMIIRVNLQFLYRRPNQDKRKLSEIYQIQQYLQILMLYVIYQNTNACSIHYSFESLSFDSGFALLDMESEIKK